MSPMKKKEFDDEIDDIELELAKLQETVTRKGMKVAIIFEGRDAAGKGGLIKTIMRRMNPRIWRVVALPKPSDREQTQWYFQRYVAHLPAGG
ncbi:MAG: polyphosphate kinase 2, partial [Pseudomonadota bacterium]